VFGADQFGSGSVRIYPLMGDLANHAIEARSAADVIGALDEVIEHNRE